MQLPNIAIILVRPQLGVNIGAVARAMKNFGFSEMRLVSPRKWPCDSAISMSASAKDVITSSKLFDNIADATEDLNFVYATCPDSRTSLNKHVYLDELTAQNFTQKCRYGLLLGPESTGLTNEDISYANSIISIRTDKIYDSLNIAQAAVILCYELQKLFNNQPMQKSEIQVASRGQIDFLNQYFCEALDKKGFFTVNNKDHSTCRLRKIFSNMQNLSSNDVNFLIGAIKSINKGKND